MDFTPETPLDEALLLARENPGNGSLYYDAFLNAHVFIPARQEGTDEGSWSEIAPDARFYPLFLNAQGTKVLPFFDTLERMQSWAEEKELDYLKVRCHLFIRTLPATVGVALNLGNAFYHFFSGEILDQLRQAAQPVTPS